MQLKSCAFILAVSGLACSGAAAQDMSDSELAAKFLAQKEVTTDLPLGKPRGLGGSRGVSIVKLEAGPEGTVQVAEDQEFAETTTVFDPNLPLLAVRFEQDLPVDIRIDFALDSAVIEDSQKPALDQVCRVMKDHPEIEVMRVAGHTDATGSEAYNARLSMLRAEEVGRYLEKTCGIDPARIQTVGYGEYFPADPADPASPRNRRVEFQSL